MAKVINQLTRDFPEATTALRYETPFQLLIATLLSAQCTDTVVNRVTPILFLHYPTPDKMVAADLHSIESIIRSTGFYKNKTRHILGTSRGLIERFGGHVPNTMEALISLPGIGRKTANLVLGEIFHQPTIVVDTHVRRVSNRLQFTKSDNPNNIEFDLRPLIPVKQWTSGAHRILLHGRHVCRARIPKCGECSLFNLCPDEKNKTRRV